MSNVQIPNLPAVTALSGEELFEGVQAGSSVKIRLGQIISAVRVGLPTTIPLPVIDGGTGVTTSTGTGSVVLSDNPTLVNASISLGTFGLGTVGAPSITFTGDTNTGIWSPGADTVAISTGGAERMRVNAIGDVGIGTSLVSGIFGRTLQVGDGSTLASINLPGTGALTTGDLYLSSGSDTASIVARGLTSLFLGTNETERMRINSAGNVGIGTNNPAVKLDVLGDGLVFRVNSVTSNNSYMRFDGTGTSFPFIGLVGGIGTFGNTDASPIRFNTNTLERMRIDSAGNVGIGLTNPAVNLDVGGTVSPAIRAVSTTNNVDTRLTSFGGVNTGIAGTFSNHRFALFSNALERLTVHASGGVSIGNIVDPGAKNLSVTGDLYLPALTTEARSIEVGNQRTGNGASLIDLVGDATYTDYGARFIREGSGPNAATAIYHRGTGVLGLTTQEAAPITFSTSVVERYRIGTAGQFGIGGANFGTAGQAFISGGPSAATSWGTLGLAGGGTGATTAPAAAAVLLGYTETATAGGTTVLTNTSSQYQLFTGTLAQTITLPLTSTLTTGWSFHIVNNSTGNLTVRTSGTNLVSTIVPGTTAMVTCILANGSTAATAWEFGYTDFSTLTGTGSVVMSNSPTLVTPNLGTGSFALGAEATPSITFAGNTDTGIWSPATNTIAASTAGVERMRISDAGVVTVPGSVSTPTVTSAGSMTVSGAPLVLSGTGPSFINLSVNGAIREIIYADGVVFSQQSAPTVIAAPATLTTAQLATGIIQYTGAVGNLTLPLGTSLDTYFALGLDLAFEFSIINTSAATVTVAVNTGVTSIGALATVANTSSRWRLRRTAVNTWVIYRL